MSIRKKGFTLIEVALFLAITGALFAAIMGGVQNSIYQQRANDSVQNFMEFLRTAYSETANVQNAGNGRSDRAIYGKLVTFGESTDLEGKSQDNSTANHIYMYDIIGDIAENSGTSDSILQSLYRLNAHAIRMEDGEKVLNGIVESYVPRWGAVIQDSDGNTFTGSLLIVRHPSSGSMYTFFSNNVIDVNAMRVSGGLDLQPINWNESGFSSEEVNFCVNPTGERGVANRQNVRISANARSGSAVRLVPESAEDYKCEWGS